MCSLRPEASIKLAGTEIGDVVSSLVWFSWTNLKILDLEELKRFPQRWSWARILRSSNFEYPPRRHLRFGCVEPRRHGPRSERTGALTESWPGHDPIRSCYSTGAA